MIHLYTFKSLSVSVLNRQSWSHLGPQCTTQSKRHPRYTTVCSYVVWHTWIVIFSPHHLFLASTQVLRLPSLDTEFLTLLCCSIIALHDETLNGVSYFLYRVHFVSHRTCPRFDCRFSSIAWIVWRYCTSSLLALSLASSRCIKLLHTVNRVVCAPRRTFFIPSLRQPLASLFRTGGNTSRESYPQSHRTVVASWSTFDAPDSPRHASFPPRIHGHQR